MSITIITDKPKPPFFRAGLIAALFVLLCALLAAGIFYTVKSTPAIGGAYSLTDSDGRLVTDRSFRGKYQLVYFGYTFCPDACPTTLADLSIALEKLGPVAQKIQPLFITIDPGRDTPAILKAYTAEFWPSLIGLTGTQDQITAVEKQYKVYAAIRRTGDGPNDYQMDHSSIFYLMDADGKFVTVLSADQDGAALAANILQYVH